jgi:hypothetical protein
LVNVRKAIGQIVVYALRWEHKELVDEVIPIIFFIQDNATMLKPSLQTPDNSIRFLSITVS